MIIAVLNQKGGTGKSTIACNIAVYLANKGKKIILVDADKQGTASQWREIRNELINLSQFPTLSALAPTLHTDLPKLDADHIIIDVGGHEGKVFRSALVAADILIVPMTPSSADFWSSEDTLQLINTNKNITKNSKVFGLINMLVSKTRLSSEINGLISAFERDYEIKFLETRLVFRVQYKNSLQDGMGITEQSTDNKAKNEFIKLMEELEPCL